MRTPALAFILALSAAPAVAGPFDGWFRPPGSVGGAGDVVPVQSEGTVADMVARVQRLEGQNRLLTGQVQELQNALRRSQDDFRKYRDDTEYRLQTLENGGKAPPMPKRSEAPAMPPAGSGSLAAAAPVAPSGPGAPPANLGTLPGQGGGGPAEQDTMLDNGGGDDGFDQAGDPNAPMQLPRYQEPPGTQAAPPAGGQGQRQMTGLAPPGLPGIAVDPNAPPPAAAPQQASLPQTPEDEYTADYRLIEGKSYEAAEIAFKRFLQEHPGDKRAPDATHFVGESLFQRQQYRDAAEQFLAVTQKYPQSRRAPSSMLRLGMSLAALGEKEAACATFQEVGRKYPSAGAGVKSGIDRETKKNGC
jgi:tol-pal system protein YbgF